MLAGPTRDQALALAGVFQACHAVDILARSGELPVDMFETAMLSLLEQNPVSCAAVFGSTDKLAKGLEVLARQLQEGAGNKPQECLRYVLGILYLQGKLSKNKDMLATIGRGIERAAEQARHFTPVHDNVIDNIADLYQNTISTYRFRIQVSGQGGYLTQPGIAKRVRCLLLAGIRAAILWQQLGGRRFHIMVYRKKLLTHVEGLLASR